MDIFTERFLPLFDKCGLNDTELEREIGLPRSIIYDWKKGRNKGYKKYADKIASYFNVSTDYLLGNEQKEKTSPSEDNEILRLIKNELNECDKDTAETILQQIRLIKSLRNK